MTKFSKILAAALLMVCVLGFSALADGWVQDSQGWKFYRNGMPETYNWATDSNGDYFYLGGDGYMVVNQFVDDRYVDSTGRMVKNDWRQVNGFWYYFDNGGHMVTGTRRQIEGLYYYFDSEGIMLTGWLSDGTDWYYCDLASGGHMLKNTWRKLEPAEEMYINDEFGGSETYWFYFTNSGKVMRATNGEYQESMINGNRFAFDTYGRMMTGWVKLASETPDIKGYKYYNDSDTVGIYGAAHTGWLSAYPPEEIDNYGDAQWYYFNSKGEPACGESGMDVANMKLTKISKNGVTYRYLFNEKGNPVYGLQRVYLDGGETSMYFGNRNQCCLQTSSNKMNPISVIEGGEGGSSWKYLFTTSGYGYTGVKNDYLYYKGKLQKSVDDSKSYYTVEGVTYLVDQNGKLVKNYNKNKEDSEVEYKSDSSGRRASDGTAGTASVSELLEPEYWEMDY